MSLTLSSIIEIAMSGLLAATLIYCAVLERRLSALRSGQDGLKQTIAELNSAIVSAGSSMRMLKATAAESADVLEQRVSRARLQIDELSVLVASGERIAERIAGGATAPKQGVAMHAAQPRKAASNNSAMPANLSGRLEALRNVR